MKIHRILFTLVLLAAAAAISHAESVYDRVMRTGTIRAGYAIYSPGVYKDANTGKLSGVAIDALNKAAENLQLKVDYVEELPWGNMIEALQSDRVDVVLYVWANSTRARMCDFSIPLFYSAIYPYARPDDKRFANFEQGMKDPSIIIAGMDGEMSLMIAKTDYPTVKLTSLGQGQATEMLLNVSHKKADIVFGEEAFIHEFLAHNPNTLKNVSPKKPLRVFANTIMIKRGQMEFQHMLDRALEELHNSGYIDQLITKYEPFPGSVLRPAIPYRQ